MSQPVTRLWTARSRHTVEQALDEAKNEYNDYGLSQVITIGQYQDGSGLMMKPSRMDHQQALWLLTRALHHVTQEQFAMDDDDD